MPGFRRRSFNGRRFWRCFMGLSDRCCFSRAGFNGRVSTFSLTVSIGFGGGADDALRYRRDACTGGDVATVSVRVHFVMGLMTTLAAFAVVGFRTFRTLYAFAAFDFIAIGITLTLATVAATTLTA
jgi:hypothetical protein